MNIKHYFVVLLLLLGGSFGSCAQTVYRETLLSDIKTLSSKEFGGRKPGTDGHNKAQTYITSRFSALQLKGFNPDYIHTFPLSKSSIGHNIIGYIPGKRKEAIVISAHYDHLGERQGRLYPGADDNASGVAALLAIAAYFSNHQPEHTLVFAAFDAEEMGLRGARAFVEDPRLSLVTIILNINLDMVSRDVKNELYASGTYHYPHLLPLICSSNPHITLKTGHDLPGSGRDDWTTQSDHAAFHERDIPFIYFGVEDHPDYHSPNDIFENIQPEFFYQAVLTILDVSIKIDRNGSFIKTKPMRRDLIMQ